MSTVPGGNKLTRHDLLPLERYSSERPDFRRRVIAHKKARRIALGHHVTLLFEDRLTVQYQIQEMLHIERIFEADEIQDELEAYNPLIPDGTNLKATMLFEFPDPVERTARLAQLVGIEHRVYARVGGQERVFARADEDLDRSSDSKTSAIHFLRFQFSPTAISELRNGAALQLGIADPRLPANCSVPAATRDALLADFKF